MLSGTSGDWPVLFSRRSQENEGEVGVTDDEYRGRVYAKFMKEVRDSLEKLNDALAKLQRSKANKEYEIMVDLYTIPYSGSNVSQIKLKIIEEV